MTSLTDGLDQVGDALERAWRRDLSHRSPVRRHRVVVLALILVVIGCGAAVAAGVLKSAADEEQGIVAGHLLFSGAAPTCEALTATSFHCTLDEPPTGMTFFRQDPAGSTIYDGKRYSPARNRLLGVKIETVDSTKHIDGGCVSTAGDGRTWNCFLGQDAVDHGVVHSGRLGAFLPEPPTG